MNKRAQAWFRAPRANAVPVVKVKRVLKPLLEDLGARSTAAFRCVEMQAGQCAWGRFTFSTVDVSRMFWMETGGEVPNRIQQALRSPFSQGSFVISLASRCRVVAESSEGVGFVSACQVFNLFSRAASGLQFCLLGFLWIR